MLRYGIPGYVHVRGICMLTQPFGNLLLAAALHIQKNIHVPYLPPTTSPRPGQHCINHSLYMKSSVRFRSQAFAVLKSVNRTQTRRSLVTLPKMATTLTPNASVATDGEPQCKPALRYADVCTLLSCPVRLLPSTWLTLAASNRLASTSPTQFSAEYPTAKKPTKTISSMSSTEPKKPASTK